MATEVGGAGGNGSQRFSLRSARDRKRADSPNPANGVEDDGLSEDLHGTWPGHNALHYPN